MEKVEYHTPEEKKICDWIRNVREMNRGRRLTKSIYTSLLEIEGNVLSTALIIKYDKSTKHVSMAHCLRYEGKCFSPTKHGKRRCTNEHAKNQYKKAKNSNTRYNKAVLKRTYFSTQFDSKSVLAEIITYNLKTGTIGYCSYFRGKTGHNLIEINA